MRLVITVVVVLFAAGCAGAGDTTVEPGPPQPATHRVGSAGVTVALPRGWYGGAGQLDPHITDPLARIAASSAPVRRRPSQCFIGAYAPPADGVTIVVVEWEQTDGTSPQRPRHLTPELLPLRTGAIECFRGDGGSVQFTERGRVFGAYVLLGEEASTTLADDARSVLDTLRVTSP